MGKADGAVVGLTQIVDHGPASRRMNIVLVAEGYQQAGLGRFADRAQQFANRLFATPPFDTMQAAFNVYRLDVSSVDAGANDPTACGGGGRAARTYFNASFCGDKKIRRLLLVTNELVREEVKAHMPKWHLILVLVNSARWGGSGGQIATTSRTNGWENLAIHEMGHSVFGLADEYEYYDGCGGGENKYAGAEPTEPNVTKEWDPAKIKWQTHGATTPMPTTRNADCAKCDPQARARSLPGRSEPSKAANTATVASSAPHSTA